MAEVAAAATVVQLIQFSGVVLTGCYEYISKAKGANRELEKVINDVSGLEGILKRLHVLISNDDNDRHALLTSLGRPDGPFTACSQALAELQKKLRTLTNASSARRKLLWPLEEVKILEVLRRLGEQKQTFILALAGDQAFSSEADAKQGKEMVETLKNIQTKEDRSKVLAWLSGADPSTNYNAARKKHEKGTGDWLLRSEQFSSWIDAEGHVMWLSGIPGAGKTVLSSTVIDHLTSRYDAQSGSRVAYYFFDFNDPGKQTLMGCLKSVLQQLCAQSTVVPEPLQTLYDTCKGKSPSAAQLTRVLASMTNGSSKDFIIIDALDECREDEVERERKAFFDALAELKDATTGCYNIFITSRPEADISSAMTTFANIALDVQGQGVADDIRSHVVGYVNKDVRMKNWPQNVKDEVVKSLGDKANGMFRWAACQLESLRTCLKPKLGTIKQKLADLPRTLDGTYERIFQEMNPEYEREMHIILMLLAFSVRPMTIHEVAEATAVTLETQSLDPDERFPDPFDILQLCSSLVSLVDMGTDSGEALRRERGSHSYSSWASKVKIIQFAHFSVKEFILSERAQRAISPGIRINPTLSQQQITELCLIYMLDFNGGKKASHIDHDAFPMLAYAALHWTTHMAAVSSEHAGQIQELLIRLFDPDETDMLMNFLNLYDPASAWRPYDAGKTLAYSFGIKRSKADFETPLYYACHYGLPEIARWLVEEDDVSAQDKEKLGPALGAAAAEGQFEIAKMLLEEGADPNSPYCGRHFGPLHAAAAGGNPKIVKMLLDAGADATVQGGEYGTALHVAAKQGNPDVVQLLIDAGTPLDIRVSIHGYPLSLAGRKGNDDAIEVLVRNGADVNVSPGGYFSPLVAAAEYSSVKSVKLLLEAGAQVNVPNAEKTALHCAAERADLDMMKLLITRGADVDGPGGVYGTPLKAAIQSREPASFRLMLESGADINARGCTSMFPVDQAIFGGNVAAAEKLLELGAKFGDDAIIEALQFSTKVHLVKTLLDRGVNPDAEHKNYGNVLQYAVQREAIEAVHWLLDAGADVNAVEGECGMPLLAACEYGDIEMVRLLLKHGALVNPPVCGEFGYPLQAAARRGKEDIVELLLDHGAHVNAKGGKYGTALQGAASRPEARVSMVLTLLQRGADVNIINGRHGTALRAALSEGNEDCARLLLKHGASLSAPVRPNTDDDNPDEDFESTLEVAVASGDPVNVQLLLDYGLDINADGEGCSSALWEAACLSKISMLDCLITHGADVRTHGGDALFPAVERNRPENLEILLRHGANPNYVNPRTQYYGVGSALECSVAQKRWNMMRSLLQAGADVNLAGPGACGSALVQAIDAGEKDIVQELLERGADVNIKAGHWGTASTRAAFCGEEELLHLLVDRGAELNVNFGYHGNPLQAAILKGYYDLANWLLDRGADPKLPGLNINALVRACSYGKPGQLDLIKRLVDMGCDLNAFDVNRPVDEESLGERYMLNPLCSAADSGNMSVAKLLLEFGADINASGGTYGNALASAVANGHSKMAKFLVTQGADVNAVGGENGTALQAAVAERTDENVNMLLAAGADVNIEGGYYGTALQAACSKGIPRFVKLLLEHGAKVNTHTGHFDCPLQAAAKTGEMEIVALLLDRGADINSRGGKYGTPLQATCCDSRMRRISPKDGTAVVELLLEKGADVNAVGGKYGTALQAAAYHQRRFVEILLQHGADPNIKGGKFGSPIRAARKKGLHRVVKLLREKGAEDDLEEEDPCAKWVYGN